MKSLCSVVAGLLLISGVASASPETKTGFIGWGPRAGMTFNPDQFHFGAHIDFGNFAQHVRVQPNVEMGFGDDLIVATANLEIAYRLGRYWSAWTPFVGGGPSFAYYREDSKGNDDSQSDSGFNLIVGIDRGFSNGNRLFLETTFGLGDVPDFKLTVGWTFFPAD